MKNNKHLNLDNRLLLVAFMCGVTNANTLLYMAQLRVGWKRSGETYLMSRANIKGDARTLTTPCAHFWHTSGVEDYMRRRVVFFDAYPDELDRQKIKNSILDWYPIGQQIAKERPDLQDALAQLELLGPHVQQCMVVRRLLELLALGSLTYETSLMQKGGVDLSLSLYAICQINYLFGAGMMIELEYTFGNMYGVATGLCKALITGQLMDQGEYSDPELRLSEGVCLQFGPAFTLSDWFMINMGAKISRITFSTKGLAALADNLSRLITQGLECETDFIKTSTAIGLFADAHLLIPLRNSLKLTFTLGISANINTLAFKLSHTNLNKLAKVDIGVNPDEAQEYADYYYPSYAVGAVSGSYIVSASTGVGIRGSIGILYKC